MTESTEPFTISRVFRAPRPLVYQMHTDPLHLARWMGPAGAKVVKLALDIRPGGECHYGYADPKGEKTWGKQVYREVVPDEKLVFLQSFSDEHGALCRHPMAASWPLQMLATTTFEDAGPGETKVTVTWQPYEADDEAVATFDRARPGMTQGFGGMFASLDAYLDATEREIRLERVVAAPRALVWKVLTDPAHVNKWWGPDGFTNVDVEQDVRVGGVWKFAMIGPDGKRWPNKSTYVELTEPERLVYDHGDWETVMFRAEVTLTAERDEGDDKTRVSMRLVCPSRAERDAKVSGFAIEGGRQHLRNLEAYVTALAQAS
ncbi:MAG TPA: SRPBCC family protein [Polyangiaceae bacterium]|nr:SRPBCC family protein [Polyangiaceae bacterium]